MHGPGIDEPLAMEKNGQTYYYHADGLGSITSLTNASGSIVQTYSYDSFGNMTQSGSISQPYTYTAREYDTETGMYFYRARYYDPRAGRFITKDPIGFKGGVNVFAYVKNNPINRIDPLVLEGSSGSIGVGGYYGGGAEASYNWTECCEGESLFKVETLTVCGGVGIGVDLGLPPAGFSLGGGVSSDESCPRTRYYFKHENTFLVRSVNVKAGGGGVSAGIEGGVYGIETKWVFCSDTVISKTKIGCCGKK